MQDTCTENESISTRNLDAVVDFMMSSNPNSPNLPSSVNNVNNGSNNNVPETQMSELPDAQQVYSCTNIGERQGFSDDNSECSDELCPIPNSTIDTSVMAGMLLIFSYY